MGKWEDRILKVLADIVARFIVGFGASFIVLFLSLWVFRRVWFDEWKAVLLIAAGVGVFYAIFGLRKGPGAI
jgi:hypothetical protein